MSRLLLRVDGWLAVAALLLLVLGFLADSYAAGVGGLVMLALAAGCVVVGEIGRVLR